MASLSLMSPPSLLPSLHRNISIAHIQSGSFPSLSVFAASSFSSSSSSSASSASSSTTIQDLLSTTTRNTDSSSLDENSFGSSLFGSLSDIVSPSSSSSSLEPKPSVECLPGLFRYEAMVVLRPDITEQQRLELTQRYEEAIITGGGMGLEVFNRGMMPLAYNIKRKDMGGITNRYLDGVFLLFNFCAKPKAVVDLQKKFNVDDDVIRSSTFKVIPPPASIARNILKKQRRAEKRKEASE